MGGCEGSETDTAARMDGRADPEHVKTSQTIDLQTVGVKSRWASESQRQMTGMQEIEIEQREITVTEPRGEWGWLRFPFSRWPREGKS